MSGISIELSGLKSTLNKLKNLDNEVAKEVDAEIGAGAREIEKSAKRLVPVDTGRLRAAISASRLSFMTWEIAAQTDYAAYVEFGTGALVDVPSGLETYALQFKGKGEKQVNMPARPYLFNSLRAYRPEIIKKIIKVLREKR